MRNGIVATGGNITMSIAETSGSDTGQHDETISWNGHSLARSDVERFVGPNNGRYWAQWRKMAYGHKDHSWNWAAAVFMIAWLGFRKMHKLAAVSVGILAASYFLASYFLSPAGLQKILGFVPFLIFAAYGLYGNGMYRGYTADYVKTISRQSSESRAALLEVEGGRNFWFGVIWAIVAWFAVTSAVAIGIAVRSDTPSASSKKAAATSAPLGPKCEVLHVEQTEMPFYINDEWDAGYLVSTIVRNASESGGVSVVIRLSTSEGTFERSQNVILQKGDSMKLEYKFHEPTVGAQNVQAQVGCSP
jgi:hypothetical protein